MTRETTSTSSHGGDPWEEFCEQLKRAGRVMQRDTTPKDDLTRAEGYRKLVHFIRVGFEANLDPLYHDVGAAGGDVKTPVELLTALAHLFRSLDSEGAGRSRRARSP